MTRPRALWMVVALAVGCGQDEPTRAAVSVELRPIESFESELWTGKQPADDPVVATVAGAEIRLSRLQRQLDLAPEGTDPAAVLDRMIEFELLAREAFEAGKYTEEVVGQKVREAMVRAWIEDHFEHTISPKDVPRAFLERGYEFMLGKFDHYEHFFVADAQILCCASGVAESCYSDLFDTVEERVDHVNNCFEYHLDDAQKLRAALEGSKTLKEFEDNFTAASMAYPQPELRSQFGTAAQLGKYDFQNDIDRTWEDQFGSHVKKIRYRVFAKPVMDGARDAWLAANRTTPVLSPVIKSDFALHILFVYEVRPERHDTLETPSVLEEVQNNAFPPWRILHFQQTMERLCKEVGCDIDHTRLVPLQELSAKKG